MLAIIGGSGFYYLGRKVEARDVITPFGDARIYHAKLGGNEVLFLPRHGTTHALPPHKINHRANVYALVKAGATCAVATYAVGVISTLEYKIGDIAIPNDFLGLHTPVTFYDDFSAGIRHTSFHEPFDQELAELVKKAAKTARVQVKQGGVVATTTGPRFESRAEVQALKKLGADFLSMNHAYETVLMKELETPFVSLVIGANYACGCAPLRTAAKKRDDVEHNEVFRIVAETKPKINMIFNQLASVIE